MATIDKSCSNEPGVIWATGYGNPSISKPVVKQARARQRLVMQVKMKRLSNRQLKLAHEKKIDKSEWKKHA